jgi:hypothetical protein
VESVNLVLPQNVTSDGWVKWSSSQRTTESKFYIVASRCVFLDTWFLISHFLRTTDHCFPFEPVWTTCFGLMWSSSGSLFVQSHCTVVVMWTFHNSPNDHIRPKHVVHTGSKGKQWSVVRKKVTDKKPSIERVQTCTWPFKPLTQLIPLRTFTTGKDRKKFKLTTHSCWLQSPRTRGTYLRYSNDFALLPLTLFRLKTNIYRFRSVTDVPLPDSLHTLAAREDEVHGTQTVKLTSLLHGPAVSP